MDVARHAAVLWRFRGITAAGLVLGILLAILASYRVSFDGGPTLTARGTETWSATASLLVTQPGDHEGDFEGVYDFAAAFGDVYEWSGIRGA